MEITHVSIFLAAPTGHPNRDRLKAGATITLDGCFVVHEIKLIDIGHRLAVTMPSRPATRACDACGEKAACLARYCPHCGAPLAPAGPGDRRWRDVAHPLDAATRSAIERAVLAAYVAALDAAAAAPAGSEVAA